MKRTYLLSILCLWLGQVSAQKVDSLHVFLDSIFMELPEVMIKGERPIVKVEEGKLMYDVPRLIEGKAVTNAFETLKELPGIISQGDDLSLAGSNSLNIIINGQLTTLSYSQLITLLKSMPASRVEKAEIMYSAPPQYNVRGSLINIVLKQEIGDGRTLQGEVAADYSQAYYGRTSARANILYSTPRLSFDVLYANNWGKSRAGEDMLSLHSLHGDLYRIEQKNRGSGENTTHNVRVGAGYNFRNKDKLNFAYTGNFGDGTNKRTSDTDFSKSDVSEEKTNIHTNNKVNGPSALHNAKLEYASHFGLVAGMDYTYFQDESNQTLLNTSNTNTEEHIRSVSEQHIHKGMFFINQTHQLGKRWGLNYGSNITFSHNDSYSNNWQNDHFDDRASFESIQKETTVNVFAGFTKTFSEAFSMQASLAAEYYKTTEESGGRKNDLWNDVALFPNANISYVFSPSHILQLAFSSDKTYPSYWEINPTIYHLNAYSEVRGNPQLKPSHNYDTQLSYIFRQKYVVVAFMNHTTDYFVQLPWQSDESLKTVFKTTNFEYKQEIGFSLVVPFKIGDILSSQLTLNGMQQRQKSSSFQNLTFDRKKLFGVAMLRNTIKLSSKPDLKLDLSGYYTTKAIQGIYDLGTTYDVSAGLKWTFAKEKAQLILRCKDIFNSNTPKTVIDYANQYSLMNVLNDTRTFTVSFIYKFGGFKESKKSEVDTSRFGR